MASWKSSLDDELPPAGKEVLVVLFHSYAVAYVAVSSSGEMYWESADDNIHGVSCSDRDNVVYWTELPPPPDVYSMDGRTSQG